MTDHSGMADAGRAEVGRRVLAAWDGFLDQAAAVDLTRDTRLPGWRAQEVCVHLGVWPDSAALAGLLELAPIVSAAPGIPGGPILQLAARTLGSTGGLLGRFRRG